MLKNKQVASKYSFILGSITQLSSAAFSLSFEGLVS